MKIEIIADNEILHRADFNQSLRITRTQDVRVTLDDGTVRIERHNFWTMSGKLAKITSSQLD